MTDIAVQPAGGMMIPSGQSKFVSTQIEKDLATGGGWDPRIQVTAGTSKVVTSGQIGVGKIAMTAGKTLTDCGKQLVGFLLAWRPKVAQYEPDLKILYNPENAEFQSIRERAEQGGANNPNQFGPEFYLWLPDYDCVATFYHGSTTLRNEGPVGIGIFNKQAQEQKWIPVLFEIDVINGKNKKTWHTTRITEYTSEIPANKYPNMANLEAKIEKFNNPIEDKPKEKATSDGGDRD